MGLPAMSGIHANINSRLSYNELFTKVEPDSTVVDVPKAISFLQKNNAVTSHININLLHLGMRLQSGAFLSFHVQERIEADLLYPREILDFIWNGGENYQNKPLNVGRVGFRATHFREFGFGYAKTVNEQLSIGARAKFLLGLADASTPGNFKASLTSDGEIFQLDADWKNAALRTSGLNIYEGEVGDIGSHMIFNSNNGVALDLGMTYELSKDYAISASLLDVGFISWKEDIENWFVNDTTFSYEGVNLDGLNDIRQTVEDTLFSKFETDKNEQAYSAWLPTRAYASWIYRWSDETDIYTTIGSRFIQQQFKNLYGLGISHRFGRALRASVNVTKLPQQFFNMGAALAATGGPVRLYIAADHMVNFSVPDAQALDVRLGINFVFQGRGGRPQQDKTAKSKYAGAKGVNSSSFLGKPIKTKKREGIYAIIKKQKKRRLKNKKSPKKKTEKKSLTGRSFDD